MLAIDRYAGEGVWIGDGIFVHVRRVGLRKVRLQFTAPPGLTVLREELRPEKRADADAIVGPGRYDYGRPKPTATGPTKSGLAPVAPARTRRKKRGGRRHKRTAGVAPSSVRVASETVAHDAA